MAKSKQEKEKTLSTLTFAVSGAKSAVMFDYQGLSVKEIEILRGRLYDSQSKMLVSKNTLLKIALEQSKISVDSDILKRPVAIAYSVEDDVAPSKVLADFGKETEKAEILGGLLRKEYITPERVSMLAKLPGKPQMQAQFLGTMAVPMTRFVGVLNQAVSGIVNLLAAYEKKISNT